MTIEILSIGSSSGGNCYRIKDGETSLLIECGLPIAKIRKGLNFTLNEISGCLVSHAHGDHSAAVKDLLKFGIHCYMSPGCAAALCVDRENLVKALLPGHPRHIGSFQVVPFPTVHDSKDENPGDTLGFYIRSCLTGEFILFATDTAYIGPRFRRLDYIMVECNYSEAALSASLKAGAICQAQYARIIETHFGLDNVVEFLKANDLKHLKEIYLLHLSRGNSDEALMLKTIKRLTGVPVYACAE